MAEKTILENLSEKLERDFDDAIAEYLQGSSSYQEALDKVDVDYGHIFKTNYDDPSILAELDNDKNRYYASLVNQVQDKIKKLATIQPIKGERNEK